jgi:hypothetical protein
MVNHEADAGGKVLPKSDAPPPDQIWVLRK